jgi:hypothetical protein
MVFKEQVEVRPCKIFVLAPRFSRPLPDPLLAGLI